LFVLPILLFASKIKDKNEFIFYKGGV